MPLTLRRGVVDAVLDRLPELVRVEVDGTLAVAYPHLTGPIDVGDEVLVNTQARQLGLGSGGFDVVYANLTRGLDLEPDHGMHVMTLPYTPLQMVVRFAEEDSDAQASLDGLPVVCCGLHSQLAPACAALAGRRVAYIQVAGGALPVSLSDVVRSLRSRDLVGMSIAVAPCCDADLQCVTIASALVVARAQGAEVVVCAIGPGIVGTGTRLGHGGLAVADVANAASSLGGRPILAPRVSHGDPRDRHRGLSHHTRAAIDLCFRPVVAWPRELDAPDDVEVVEVDAQGWRNACDGLPLSHMGRGPDDDPWFFAASFAAGLLALRYSEPVSTRERP